MMLFAAVREAELRNEIRFICLHEVQWKMNNVYFLITIKMLFQFLVISILKS